MLRRQKRHGLAHKGLSSEDIHYFEEYIGRFSCLYQFSMHSSDINFASLSKKYYTLYLAVVFGGNKFI